MLFFLGQCGMRCWSVSSLVVPFGPAKPLLSPQNLSRPPRRHARLAQVAVLAPPGGASSSASTPGALAAPLRQLPPREDEVNSLAIDHAEKFLATADDSGCVQARLSGQPPADSFSSC